ncbi:MAG: hypothetical protein HC924_17530 [Synechococcaceae cyanobacterium SM2_3_2]|nr:hypothetical protein [Synechococcaceae cyanobacterium SM2_3_2]
MIIIASKSAFWKQYLRHQPGLVISIGDPGDTSPRNLHYVKVPVLRLEFEDHCDPDPTALGPQNHHIRILLFAARTTAPLLVHCHAGLSRSPAAALIILTQQLGGAGYEHKALHQLLANYPRIHPNQRMLTLADQQMGTQLESCVSMSGIWSDEG